MSFPPSVAATRQAEVATYGRWLAELNWKFSDQDENAWVVDADGRYIAEGVVEDSEQLLLPVEQMHNALQLMQHAPRLLRFVLRGLEVFDSPGLSDKTMLEHLRLLLEEVAGDCLKNVGKPREVARAVEQAQQDAFDEMEDEDDEELMEVNVLYACKHTNAITVLSFRASNQQQFNRGLSKTDTEAEGLYRRYSRELETLTGDDELLAWWELNYQEPVKVPAAK